jgi:hypothetical protein
MVNVFGTIRRSENGRSRESVYSSLSVLTVLVDADGLQISHERGLIMLFDEIINETFGEVAMFNVMTDESFIMSEIELAEGSIGEISFWIEDGQGFAKTEINGVSECNEFAAEAIMDFLVHETSCFVPRCQECLTPLEVGEFFCDSCC